MDKGLTIDESADEVAYFQAQIDRYIAEMQRIERELKVDAEEIKQLQSETRKILKELLQAA